VAQLIGKLRTAGCLAILMLLLGLAAALAQQTQPQPDQRQDIPDAPSAVQPPPPAPAVPPAEPQTPPANAGSSAQPAPPSNEAPPSSTTQPAPPQPEESPGPPPPFKIKTVPQGGATQEQASAANEELFKLKTDVNFVEVPVTVKDDSGHMVNGLLATDFSVFEDGQKQTLKYFTSDPFALSAAVVLDLGMPDIAVQKVNETFPALEGAFSQFDEVSIYVYSSTVARVVDFSAAGKKLTGVLNQLKTAHGENNGVPVLGGPMGPEGPTVNGVPIDSPTSPVITPSKQSHVLNDAVLAAARDLSSRDKTRRKIIFIISDGREYRSDASYSDVLKVLLSNGIMVYGVGVESSAIPGYNKIEKLHLPKFGYSDILPKYANATGGEILNEYSRTAIEGVYARVIGAARNQYTLGYTTRATPSSTYREIEVRVDRPGCKTDLRPCVNVYAREGYYPLPPGR